MKATLIALLLVTVTGVTAVATPARRLNKSRVEEKRDASREQITAPAPAAAPGQAAAPAATAKPSARTTEAAQTNTERGAPSTQPTASSSSTERRAQAAAPAPQSQEPSQLTRAGKPPSSRFFSRVRTDASRNASKAKRTTANRGQQSDSAKPDKIYRRTWGPRAHRRPR